jgi:hypothetical protein
MINRYSGALLDEREGAGVLGDATVFCLRGEADFFFAGLFLGRVVFFFSAIVRIISYHKKRIAISFPPNASYHETGVCASQLNS